ncbi:MAG: sialidase family protein [Rhodothermales bacterium]
MAARAGLILGVALVAAVTPAWAQDAVLSRGFIFEDVPFESAHASTIVETAPGELLAAWFGGSDEGEPDVEIWVARKSGSEPWTMPRAVTSYPEMPCWNPVLYHGGETTTLYFKVGPSPREWVGAYRTSEDGGQTWSDVTYLPAGLTGPIRAKPIRLEDGTLLAGTSFEAGYTGGTPSDAPYRTWSVWVERSTDGGRTWTKHGPIGVPGELYGVIQPTLWESSPGVVRMLMRATGRIGYVPEAVSTDGGRTWSQARPTRLPNPNAGIDVVKLSDGRLVLIYNHTERGRSPIHLAVSSDDGATWSEPLVLEEGQGEFSYPAVIQAEDGRLHVTYTWRRERVRHLVVDAETLPGG